MQPDVLFISNERVNIVTDPEIVGAPDLVVEVLSPGSVKRDRSLNMALYSRSGVREYWIVDPKLAIIEVFALDLGAHEPPLLYRLGDRLTSGVLAGFDAPVSEVFRAL